MELAYSHVDILVDDLDAAVDYYKRVLGCTASPKEDWKRGDFHVEYVVLFKNDTRFYFVYPISGNLRDLLERKGPGTIYRFCFTCDDMNLCFDELVQAGVQPENENGAALSKDDLSSPAGVGTIWLPKIFGDLSLEVLDRSSMERRMATLRDKSN